jgi:hypothetical protein
MCTAAQIVHDPAAFVRSEAIVALAGGIAQKRCLRGSGAGWLRIRSWDEQRVHHEAAHAIFSLLHGRRVLEVSIVADFECVDERNPRSFSAGRVWTCDPSIENPTKAARTHFESDRESIAKYCWLLASPRPTWKSTLYVVRDLQGEARELVERYWPWIDKVARALLAQRSLDEKEFQNLVGARVPLLPGAPTPAAVR